MLSHARVALDSAMGPSVRCCRQAKKTASRLVMRLMVKEPRHV